MICWGRFLVVFVSESEVDKQGKETAKQVQILQQVVKIIASVVFSFFPLLYTLTIRRCKSA